MCGSGVNNRRHRNGSGRTPQPITACRTPDTNQKFVSGKSLKNRVEPGTQQALIDLLSEATEHVMKARPGFLSANLHRSLDGKRVVNYAQWASKDDLDAMMRDPAAREHMGKAAELAKSFDPVLYEVAAIHAEAGGR